MVHYFELTCLYTTIGAWIITLLTLGLFPLILSLVTHLSIGECYSHLLYKTWRNQY